MFNTDCARVLHYFEEICKIPHGSGDTKRISDYCADFAEKHGLRYVQDDLNDIIIFKDATKGFEGHEPVIIQGHLDMVCEKESDVDFDFTTDSLKIEIDGDFISAKGTTLGGDDGIAIAYALALLESDTIEHPPIEAVFTVDEETGMYGAAGIDTSVLKGKRLSNIDSEEEGVLLVSCAGGRRQDLKLPVTREFREGVKFKITVGGLMGGHSGTEIDKGRANASIELGKVLRRIREVSDFGIMTMAGGLKDNAIPREAEAVIVTNPRKTQLIEISVGEMEKILKFRYKDTDPDMFVKAEVVDDGKFEATDDKSTVDILAIMSEVPNGVQKMSEDIKGLVQTSLNMGIMELYEDSLSLRFALRSSVNKEKEELSAKLDGIIDRYNGTSEQEGDYPAWEFKKGSKLTEIIAEEYERLSGEKLLIQSIHAGLECGMFCGKIPNLDCVSFGPNIYDIHTPKERMSLSSVERVWELLKAVLKKM